MSMTGGCHASGLESAAEPICGMWLHQARQPALDYKRTICPIELAGMNKVTDVIERHPNGTFLTFLLVHGVVWTALPAIFFRNLPLDLIEALVYGREWQLGHDKLPPLPWWLAEAVYRVFGPDLFLYLLAQLTVLASFALVWTMARQLVGAVGALVAVLIIDGLAYFTFAAPKFNHDVIQLPFWALAGYAYWAALRRGRMLHWLLLGFAIGMSVWAKYFVVVQAVPLALFTLIDRDARKSLATPGPYVAAAVALLVMAPHLIWLVQNEFLPFAYAAARAQPFTSASDYVIKPLQFVLSQLGYLLPALMIAAPYLRRDVRAPERSEKTADAFDRRIVTLLAIGPLVMTLMLSVESGRSAVPMWGYPLWLFFGLWIVLSERNLERVTLRRIVFLWSFCFIVTAGSFVFAYQVLPLYRADRVAVLFPGDQLGIEMSKRFRALTGQPLKYVIGTMWLGGNISHYAPEHPRVLMDAKPSRAPCIDLGDLRAHGAIVIWNAATSPKMPQAYRAIADDAEAEPLIILPRRFGLGEVAIRYAILRPRPMVADAAGDSAR
jgi:4-amino-4-deoxy-L-arabinose transferase-like glycosyltransferase